MENRLLKNLYHEIIPEIHRHNLFIQRLKLSRFFHHLPSHLFDRNVLLMPYRLKKLRNAYKGKRCFIMGNGPSLNDMDLSLFENEYVWGSNKVFLLFDRIKWRPSFYIAIDLRVVPDISCEISELIEKIIPETKFFFPVHFRENGVLKLPPDDNLFWYQEIALDESKLYSTFTLDASKWVSSARTVTISALQLAVYLGFNPIYLIGCDTSYTVPSTVEEENNDANNLVSTKNDDPNHFSPDYFGKGSKWHAPHVDRMIFHYQQAKTICDRAGVSVINATLGGKLEVFPRVDYTKLFK